ncbi:MAG: penicillin-binding protein 2 [Fidelibacterota bacterium]
MLKAQNLIPKERQIFATSFVLLLMFILGVRFFFLQVYRYEKYKNRADVNRIRAVVQHAPRGLILDREGRIIVDNNPTYILTAIPGEMEDPARNFQVISRCTNIDSLTLVTNYEKFYRGRFVASRLAKDLTFDQLSRLEEHKTELTGVNYKQFPERYYPTPTHASHVLGYVREVDKSLMESAPEMDKYELGDVVGWVGLEKYYEARLRGTSGVKYIQVDALGREMGSVTEQKDIHPTPGGDLRTTLWLPLQHQLEVAMQGVRGVAVVSKPATGEILAFVSMPDYAPDLFTGATKPEEWQRIIENPDKPLLNRVTNGLYPPGSTLKIITAIDLLERGLLDPRERIECTGVYQLGDREFRCWKPEGHGLVNLREALAQSCNIYFYKAVQRLTLDQWAQRSRAFGFGAPTGIDLPSEASGIVPTSDYMRKLYGRWGWSVGHLLNLALGQGEILVTPIQMVMFINQIAMRGQAPPPHIAFDRVGEQTLPLVVSASTWKIIQEDLQAVIIDPLGTGRGADPHIPGLTLAGKTGTAENPHGEPHAWFISYGEKEGEIVSVVVLIENGGHGGAVAAPIAKMVYQQIFGNTSSDIVVSKQ